MLGADGHLGRLVGAALDHHGLAWQAAGEGPGGGAAAIVVGAVPESPRTRAAIGDVVAAGGRWVDAIAAPSHVRALLEDVDDDARQRGATVVPGAGWWTGIGDLLTARAAAGVADPAHVHVAYWVPGRRSVLRTASPGERTALLRGLAEPMPVVRDARLVQEHVGEARRLAWFPRPVGPHHAAAVAGGEPVTVPRHVAGLRTVRTYVAIRTWTAELLQAAGSLARTAPGQRWLSGRDERTAGARSRTAGERWAVVAELATASGAVHRAWAYGTDRHGVAAALVALAARDLAAGAGPAGVVVPGRLAVGPVLLDALAAVTDLRWSVARPG